MIKSAQEVIDVARSRGLEIEVRPGPPPTPVLVIPAGGKKSHEEAKALATPALLEALRAWRSEIIQELAR